MTHKSYVYDTERRYAAAVEDGVADNETRRLFADFLRSKRQMERAESDLMQGESLMRDGVAIGCELARKALRYRNGAECDLSFLSRRIALRILKARDTSSTPRRRTAAAC